MSVYLLLATIVILICIIFNKIFSRLGIPTLLAFIGIGIFFGSDGVVKIPFDNYVFAEQICSIALIFIMFYGGFGTKWSAAKPVFLKAVLLSSVGVVITALITGLFCFWILKFDFLESLLIGAVISSTDAASVFFILRSKKLNLKDNTASMLEVESGSNDPAAYMLTAILLLIMSGNAKAGQIIYMVFAQVSYAVVLGIIIAFLSLWVLKNIRFGTSGFDAVFVFAIALFSYALPALIGGNGYLSAYIVGIIMGNKPIKNKKALVHFFDGVTGLMQMLIFFLLGLLAFPSQMPEILLPAILIALFLTFLARPLAIFGILSPFKCSINQQLLVAWSGLRGAASVVFAIMATISPLYTKNDIFHIVFCIVLFSIMLQGSLLPFVAKKLKMIDKNENIMKTFTDYTEEVPVQFIRLAISKNHPWVGSSVKDISLPPDTLLALILRDNEKIIPKGNNLIFKGDILVLSAKTFSGDENIILTERRITETSDWLGKSISQIDVEPDKLVIMIKRNDRIIIPRGKTILKNSDVLVINQESFT